MVIRHRVSIADAAALITVLLTAGGVTYAFDVTGGFAPDRQVNLAELIGLGVLMLGGLGLFAWRRLAEQEREIARRADAEAKARFLAHHDYLTGLPNRRQLDQALENAATLRPSADRAHAFFALDLNGFKGINDTLGHAAGDELLSIVARRIDGCLRDGDLLVRSGGDEFILIARDVLGPEAAANLANRILSALDAPIAIGAELVRIGTGIGISLLPRDGVRPAELLRKADVALYKAKRSGASALAFYQDEMDAEAREREQLRSELASAIGTEDLVPHYQPIVDLKSGRITAFEALARWTSRTRGAVPPARFIPIAEDSGLIQPLTDWLLERACADAQAWPDDILLTFNLSPVLLHDANLVERVLKIARQASLSTSRLELEIGENALVQELEATRDTLAALRAAGLRVALDDFGTGASSLYHLRSFKFDTVKIDRSFIEAMTKEPESAAIVRAILGMAAGLGISVIAEGVEGPAQRELLSAEGCAEAQGFLYGSAVSAAEVMRMLADGGRVLEATKGLRLVSNNTPAHGSAGKAR
jgi:diguanylate cyclase (GGDEF)-like protein